jgi:hypothetical protein
MQKTERLKKC